MTRGIANNNPGNLRKSADPWQGLSEVQNDKDFFQFKTPSFGIRALAKTLITYQDKYGLNCLSDIINRWAPRSENDTTAYCASVANQTGFGLFDPLNLQSYENLAPLVKAIIRQENGEQPYAQSVIDDGLKMAGVVKSTPPSLARDPKVIGTAVVTAAATAQQVATNVSSVWQSLADISPNLPNYVVIGLGAIAVLVVAAFAIEQVFKRIRGIA